MTSKLKLLVATSGIAAAMLGANPAFAAGTTSGTDIVNNVSVTFQVGGVAQTAQTASDTFKVDRKINLTVAEVGNTTTTVSPGQTAAVTAFTVTNTSNAVLDFGLSASQIVGGTAAHGGTDNFNVAGLAVFLDVNNNGTYEPGTDTATFIDELAADATRTVFIIGNIPGAQVTGDVAGVVLTATAKESGAIGTQGVDVTQTAGANTAGVDTVFADVANTLAANGAVDAERNGRASAGDDYTVAAANLTAFKTSRVVSDPFNGTTNPKAIPGAIVEYCISVANAAGSATATNVVVTDTLPADVGTNGITFVTGSILLNGTAVITGTGPTKAQTCSGGTSGGTFSDPTVSGSLSDIAANTNRTLIFRVTVD